MKRLFGQVLFVAGVGTLSVAFTPACVENDQAIFVRQVMAPPQNRQNGSCLYTNDPTQPALFEGVLDVAVRGNYSAVLLVGGQLIPRGDQLNTRAESNRSHIDGAVVRVTGTDGSAISEFTSVGSGFVDPGLANQAAFGLVRVTLLDQGTVNQVGLDGTNSRLVIANVKVFGQTLGGVDLESGEFQFPIRVCNGCLVDFSSGDNPNTPELDCSLGLGAAGGGGGQQVLPCLAGQDEATPCQLCAGTSDVCKGR